MKRTLVIALFAVAALATGSFAYAAIPSTNGTISACMYTKGPLKGTMQVIDAEDGKTCGNNQQLLTWNQQGPPGPPGPAGAGARYVSVDESGAIDAANSEGFEGGVVTMLPGDENGGLVYCISVPFDFHAVWVQHNQRSGASVDQSHVLFTENRDDLCSEVAGTQELAVYFSRPAFPPTTATDFMLLFL